MSDYLAEIEKIVEEHQTIRDGVKLVGDSVSDQEALNSLRSIHSDWVPGQPELLPEKQNRLRQTVSFLDEGLRNHFAAEEKVLPLVLGEFLMQALRLEHQEILEAISRAKSVTADTKLEGLSQEELMSKDLEMKNVVNNLSHLINGHAEKEELMLEMVKRVLNG